jgi:uncharacterized protein (TIGR02145 family)
LKSNNGLWQSPNVLLNDIGFSALPSGYRNTFLWTPGTFGGIGGYTYFWSSTESSSFFASIRNLVSYNSNFSSGNSNKSFGHSVRCIQDSCVTSNSSAGPDQFNISGVNTSLFANNPAIRESGEWVILSGKGGSFSSKYDPNATFFKGLDSNYSLIWAITSKCGISQDTLNLNFKNTNNITSCSGIPTIVYFGDTYPIVQIGSQCWMAKNLNVGTMINSSEPVDSQRNNSLLEKYCFNNDVTNCSIFGGLYQWAEAVQYQNGAGNSNSPSPSFLGNVKGICPAGWHLPSDAEFCTLTTFLDSLSFCSPYATIFSTSAGGKLMATTGYWAAPNSGISNSSEFSALPGGCRNFDGKFSSLGEFAGFWTSFESNAMNSKYYSLFFINSNLYTNKISKSSGHSVRCLKD